MADAFADSGGDEAGTVTTICAHRLEVEVLVRADPGVDAAFERLLGGLRERLGDAVYAEDERSLEEHVLDRCRARG